MPFLGLAHPVSRAGIGAKSAKEYTPLTVLYKHVYDIYCVMIYTKTPEQLRIGPRGRAAASRRNGCPGRVGEGWLVRDVVKRLRRNLGEDGSNPRYVFAEPRAGYRMARPDRDPVRRRGNRPRLSRQKTAHTDGRAGWNAINAIHAGACCGSSPNTAAGGGIGGRPAVKPSPSGTLAAQLFLQIPDPGALGSEPHRPAAPRPPQAFLQVFAQTSGEPLANFDLLPVYPCPGI